jgi:UDP:flavonoid glycosyltransferase YjiC (YdhE family)
VTRRTVALFAMPERGHFQQLAPLISGLTDQGVTAYVFTDRRFEPDIVAAGATFVDLFSRYPLEPVDDESIPVPCRYVSFAGAYAEQIAADLGELRTDLVIYETFAVVGHVAARLRGLPYVNVCAGHNMDPAQLRPQLEADPRVALSAGCRRAVEVLRDRYGIEDASPFSYLSGLSPFLNVYCEPPAFLTAAEREVFEPIAFFGSLPSPRETEAKSRQGGARWFGDAEGELKVYVSFGTVVWRYWAAQALDALHAISDALAEMDGVRVVLGQPNIEGATKVDQWSALQEADLFVTHHGLNSTHEAIFHRVPMISYPFFSDQPALARRCQELGLAIPLTESTRAPLAERDVRAAISEFTRRRESMHASLSEAREWELDVMAGRHAVVRRLSELAG